MEKKKVPCACQLLNALAYVRSATPEPTPFDPREFNVPNLIRSIANSLDLDSNSKKQNKKLTDRTLEIAIEIGIVFEMEKINEKMKMKK